MTIQAKLLRMLAFVMPVIGIAAVILDNYDFGGRLGHALHVVACPFMIVVGCLGALAAILQRAGIIRFHYTDDDKRGLLYRMARFVAEMEHSHGRPWSHHYYESYGLASPNQSKPHEKPPA